MKWIAPDDYTSFACLMGACRHSCCIGWEIDVDDEALARYEQVPGQLGQRLRENIDRSGASPCFRLTPDERCPFLQQDGLCELILSLGEDCLCQICTDHPRFRQYFDTREEIGLGLCCEAAGQMLLSRQQPMQLVVLQDDGADEEDEPFVQWRDNMLDIIRDRSVSVQQRAQQLLHAVQLKDAPVNYAEWAAFLLQLERLDDAWTQQLQALAQTPEADEASLLDTPFEQLLFYLAYRHLSAAVDDGDLQGRMGAVVTLWRIIRRLCAVHLARSGSLALDDMVEIARLFSSEIEYSDENMDAVIQRVHSLTAQQNTVQ